ncbi:MAG: putative Ig domain-containing protein, partial [Actinomycetota bacterium]
NEQHYEIEQAPFTNSACGTFALVATIGAGNTSFPVGGLTGATTYCFRVRAVNDFGGGTSATSDAATGTTASPPAAYVCTTTSFSWIDTTAGTPSLYTLGDDASTSVTLPFSFPLYGVASATAQISSNGFVRVGSGAATAFANAPIPSAGDPENVIAPWWDDLNPAAGGSVWSMTLGSSPNRQFVVTWSNVPHYGTAGSEISNQVVLDEATGAITLQYLDTVTGSSTSNGGASATVGLENSDGTVGTQIGYNQAVLADGTALRCTDRPVNSPTITTASLAVGTVGTTYSQALAGSAGTTPYAWSVNSGSLPAGLSLNPSTGEIGGNPTVAGTASFSIKITDSASLVATKSLSITIAAPVTVTTASLANGAVGTAYSATLAASGGTGTYTWGVTGGSLPAGLSLASSTGRSRATPTTAATSNFTVTATDGIGRTSANPLSITVSGAIPGSFNKSAPSNNASSRPRNGLVLTWVASTGVVSYQYCVDTSRNSTCNSSWVSVGSSLSATINGLGSKTSYEWQVRAVNTTGTRLANNGTWWKFTTAT